MTADQQDRDSIDTQDLSPWQTLRARYRQLDARTHRLLGWALKASVIIYFLGCAGYLATRHLLWPQIENYKTQIEQAASQAMGKPVSIARMRASWDGFSPHLTLEEVVMHDDQGQKLLSLPQVSATLSWWSIPAMNARFKKLEIVRPELDIRRDRQGNIRIAGMLFDSAKETDSDGAQWVLSQNEIIIREGKVRWQDDLRQAPELALEDVRIVIQNAWWFHKLLLTARPPTALAAPLEVRGDFRHPLFASDIADVRRWKGTVYADLQSADLAAWKAYLDYPFELSAGQGTVRAWLTLDQARVADFTADLSLKDVSARLGSDLAPLDLVEIRGRISARERGWVDRSAGKLRFGETGHRVELIDVSLTTRDGLVLPETTISEAHYPGLYGEPSRTFVRLKQIDLETLGQFTKYIPMTADLRKMLADLSPKGRLKNFEVQWEGAYPELVSYRVGGEFSGLTLKAQPAATGKAASGLQKTSAHRRVGIPGFENLSGRIHANHLGGNVALDATDLVLYFPGVFKEAAMKFDAFKMRADWSFQEKQNRFELAIDKANFVHEGIAGTLSGKHVRQLSLQDTSPGYVDLSGEFSGLDVKKLDRYLPLVTPDGLRQWLTGGIEEGFARNIQFKLKGDLADFPFVDPKTGRRKGDFVVSAGIENARLNYTPGAFAGDGKSPMWPLAEKIQGRISVNGTRMEIEARTAETANVGLSNVVAVIPDLQSDDMQVEITGSASGALQDFLRYTTVTPVADWIGNFTEDTQGSGHARLALKMVLPLERLKDSKARGILQFENNEVKLLKDLPLLSNVKGKLEFYESGFKLHDIRAGFLGGEARVSGGTQSDGKFVIKGEGDLTIAGVRKVYPTVPARISGKTTYVVTISERGRLPDIRVESSLRGIALDYPAPLKKVTNDTLPLVFQLSDQTVPNTPYWRDQMDMALGKHIAARYQRQKFMKPGAVWHVTRGGIGLQAKPPEPAAGVALRATMGPLNVDTWKTVLGPTASGPKDPKGGAPESGIAPFLPTRFSIKTPRLTASGLQFDQVELHVEPREASLQVGIKSRQATGHVNLADDPKSGQSKVVARLTELQIASSLVPKASELLEASDKPVALPNLDITAENFELHGRKLGRLELVAGNAPGKEGRQWDIDKLVIDNPGGTLNASGKWIARKDANKTRMQYAMKIKDAGKLLDRLGFKDVLDDGEGKIQGTLAWNDTPFALDKASLSGKISLSMKKGQFLPAEPGVAKLLNVLSLQSLPRRLVLDFRDVFSKGFAFDRLSATADITKGVLKTDNLKMQGVGSTVLMEGQADIVSETQDLHVVVIPKFDASAASIAAGFAGGPVVGVGAFLAQLFLKDPLMKAMTFEYHVTGSWAEPTVTKLDKKRENKAED